MPYKFAPLTADEKIDRLGVVLSYQAYVAACNDVSLRFAINSGNGYSEWPPVFENMKHKYFSIYKNTWLPISWQRNEYYCLDSNVMIDLEDQRPGFELTLAALQSSPGVDINYLILEGRQQKTVTLENMKAHYSSCRKILSKHRVNNIFPFKQKLMQMNIMEEDPNYTAIMDFLFACDYEGFVFEPSERFEKIIKVVELAKKHRLSLHNSYVCLIISAFFIQRKKDKIMKDKKLNKAKRNSLDMSPTIYNVISDMRYSRLMSVRWTLETYKCYFCTRDQALAGTLLDKKMITALADFQHIDHLFPNITKEEFEYLKVNGLLIAPK